MAKYSPNNQYISLADYRNVQQELIAAQEEIGRLREALKPFAEFAKITDTKTEYLSYLSYNYLFEDGGDKFYQITGNDFKKAREALK